MHGPGVALGFRSFRASSESVALRRRNSNSTPPLLGREKPEAWAGLSLALTDRALASPTVEGSSLLTFPFASTHLLIESPGPRLPASQVAFLQSRSASPPVHPISPMRPLPLGDRRSPSGFYPLRIVALSRLGAVRLTWMNRFDSGELSGKALQPSPDSLPGTGGPSGSLLGEPLGAITILQRSAAQVNRNETKSGFFQEFIFSLFSITYRMSGQGKA